MPSRTKKPNTSSQDALMQDVPPSAQADSTQDAEMTEDAVAEDDEAAQEEEEEEEEEEEVEPQRVRILPGSTDTAASFEFINEGHTLGNALRYVIMKNPDVEFCAYTIPHPSEPKMNIRIQTYEGTAMDALKMGLTNLQDICDVVAEDFWTSRQAFSAEHAIDR